MKKLKEPQLSARDSYLTCIYGVSSGDLKSRLEACCDTVDQQALEYIAQANEGELYTLAPLTCLKGEDPVVIGNVLKSELVKLYNYYMVKKHPARNIYDKLLLAANDKCPFCGGIGRPKTLDHFLPKANYPQFSVFPLNLVPACRDCNTGKRNTLATSARDQVLHPYLDDDCFFTEQWIFARVVQTEPCAIEFYVSPPENWDGVSKDRVNKHFDDFDLAKRYSIQAAEELSTLVDQRSEIMSSWPKELFVEFLTSVENSVTLFCNHWKRVTYQTLAKDEWFCTTEV